MLSDSLIVLGLKLLLLFQIYIKNNNLPISKLLIGKLLIGKLLKIFEVVLQGKSS